MRIVIAVALVVSARVASADSVPEVAAMPAAGSVELPTKPIAIVFDPPIRGATPAELDKLEAGRVIAERALNDPDVRARIVYFSSVPFGGAAGDGYQQAERKHPKRAPIASNAEVLDALMRGNDPDGTIHLVIDVAVDIAHSHKHTTVKTFASTPLDEPRGITTINPTWLDRESTTPAKVADNLIHEHMHRLGFVHEDDHSHRRCASVPYVVGHLVCNFGDPDMCVPLRTTRC